MILVVRERAPLLGGSRTLQVMPCDKQKATALPDPMRTSAANFAAEQAPKMQQRGGRPLERSCRTLNENVRRAVLIKSCAERSLDDNLGIFLVEASPYRGTRSRKSREHTREMTLIGKATSQGDLRQRELPIAQEPHGALDTPM
jgi:hypothetical protein